MAIVEEGWLARTLKPVNRLRLMRLNFLSVDAYRA
jgi:hypothetical protein